MLLQYSCCITSVYQQYTLYRGIDQIRLGENLHCVYYWCIEAQKIHTRKIQECSFPVVVGPETLQIHARILDARSDCAIVAIPGHTDSSASFAAMQEIAYQHSSRYSYISFDIAWGKSRISRFPYTKNHQLAIITAFLEQVVLKEYAESIHLVGHSMGAELALMQGLAEETKKSRHPQYQSYIASITAVAPAIYPRGLQLETFDFISLLPAPAVRALGQPLTPAGIKKIINGEIRRHNGRGLQDEDFQLMHENMIRDDGIVRIFDVQRHMHYLRGSEFLQQYPDMSIPLQFILGDADRKISRTALRRIPRDFPDRRITVYPDCSHFIHYQYPERLVQDIIQFADSNSATDRETTAS